MGAKEAYQQKLEAQQKEWRAKIDALKAQADGAEADAKLKAYEEIEALRVKLEAVQGKAEQLRQAGEGAWEEAKLGVEKAWDDIKQGFEKATARFK